MRLRVMLLDLVVRRRDGDEIERQLSHRHSGQIPRRRDDMRHAVTLRLRHYDLMRKLLLLKLLLLLLLLLRRWRLLSLLLFWILFLWSFRSVFVVNALHVFSKFVLPARSVCTVVTFERPLLKN